MPSADSVGASGKSVVPASPSDGSSSAAPTSGGDAPVETVTISVNGREEPVGKGGTFPHSAPTFRLVSFGKGTAEIGIVGGSYATGGETVTLKRGEPLTLVNTTDDTRYRIVLVRKEVLFLGCREDRGGRLRGWCGRGRRRRGRHRIEIQVRQRREQVALIVGEQI